MKNYLFKGLLTLFTVIALGSCTKETLDLVTDHPPMVEADDVQINLTLADLEQNMPPQTRAMPEGGDSKFDESLTAIVFDEVAGSPGKYKYYSVRPVVKGTTANSFNLSLPGTLIGRNVRLHVYSNSMEILTPNIYTRFTLGVTTEEEVIAALTLTTTGRWNVDPTAYSRIPMYGKSDFTLQATTTTLSPISLRRMMARVDVGLNYNNVTETATPGTLNNFKIIHMFVYNTVNKGQLIAGANDPTIPKNGVGLVPAYQSNPQPNVTNSIIRDVFLFEHENDGTAFDSDRPCIILYGDYCPDPVNNPTIWDDGYYRIDFYKEGNYLNIIRNTLYRFDIKSVSGVGHPTPEDALKNVASNVVISLQSYAMGHNETEFNGQDYLSVNKSTLTVYTNRPSDNFTVKTSYQKGWKIESSGHVRNTHFAPFKEDKPNDTETLVTFNLSTTNGYPDAQLHEFFITAGNLKKKMYINIIDGPAPDNLQNFSIPPVLYFARGGGSSTFNVTTNIKTASFNFTAGQIKHGPISSQVNGNGTVVPLPLIVQPTDFTKTADNSSILGSLQVDVIAGNADLSASSKIIQFTDPKALSVYMAPIPAAGATSHRMRYVLPDNPQTEIGTSDHRYYVVNVEDLVRDGSDKSVITSPDGATGYNFNIPANHTYSDRDYFRFTVYPTVKLGSRSLDDKIDIIGHTPPVVVVKQAAAPEPTFDTASSAINHDNREANVVVSNGSGAQSGYVVSYKDKDIFGNGTLVSQSIEGVTSANAILPTGYNRGGERNVTVKVFAVGYGGVHMPVGGKSQEVIQRGAKEGDYDYLRPRPEDTVGPDEISYTFKLGNMKLANMFGATLEKFTHGSPGLKFSNAPTGDMTYTLGDEEATFTFNFQGNEDIQDRTTTFEFRAYAINTTSVPSSKAITFKLTQEKTNRYFSFDLKQTGGANPILTPFYVWNKYYITNVEMKNIVGARLEIREGSTTGNTISTSQISRESGDATIDIGGSGDSDRTLFLVAVGKNAIDGQDVVYQTQELKQKASNIQKKWGSHGKSDNYNNQCEDARKATINGLTYSINDSRLPLYYGEFEWATNFDHVVDRTGSFWYYHLDTSQTLKSKYYYFQTGREPYTTNNGITGRIYYRCVIGSVGKLSN